jgi:hypothetical protein
MDAADAASTSGAPRRRRWRGAIGGGGSPTGHSGGVIYMNYIMSDTSKRKMLSTRGGAEFSSGMGAANGAANTFVRLFHLQNKCIYRFARWTNENVAARATMRSGKYPDSRQSRPARAQVCCKNNKFVGIIFNDEKPIDGFVRYLPFHESHFISK